MLQYKIDFRCSKLIITAPQMYRSSIQLNTQNDLVYTVVSVAISNSWQHLYVSI